MAQANVAFPGTQLSRVQAYLGQCDIAEVLRCRERFGGVTLQGTNGLEIAKKLHRAGDLWGVDVDPAQYRERPRSKSSQPELGFECPPFDWISAQSKLGLPVVRTAGPRIRVGRLDDLRAELNSSYPVEVSVVLALDAGWLGRRHIDSLEEEIRRAHRDVSLIFADVFDPLDTAQKIWSVRRLLRGAQDSYRNIELLRTDLVGLPAAMEGAAAAAIGLGTSTRHLGLPLPRKQRADYDRRQQSPLVFVPRLLHWQRVNVLGALAPWSGAGVTSCDCASCSVAGQDLMRFDSMQDGASADVKKEIREHDELALSTLIREVMGAEYPSSELKARRIDAVQLARSTTSSLKVNLNVPPAWLDNWD